MKTKKATFRARLAAFFVDISKSCYDMERYRIYRTRPWQEAARYFAAFLGTLSLIVGIAFAVYAAPMPAKIAAQVRSALPEGASFTVSGGVLSTTPGGRLSIGTDALPFVIDASVEGMSAPGPDAPKDGFLIGRDAVFFMDDGEAASIQSLTSLPDGAFTKEDLAAFLDSSGPLLVAAASAMFALAHLAFLALNTAIFVLLASWLASLVGKMWGLSLTYRQWVAVGLHAVTLPIIADHLFWGLPSSGMFMFPILYFMIIIAVILDERQSPTGDKTAVV